MRKSERLSNILIVRQALTFLCRILLDQRDRTLDEVRKALAFQHSV